MKNPRNAKAGTLQVGFEPTTFRLTAGRSTAEPLENIVSQTNQFRPTNKIKQQKQYVTIIVCRKKCFLEEKFKNNSLFYKFRYKCTIKNRKKDIILGIMYINYASSVAITLATRSILIELQFIKGIL